jgi:hypothetical protein
VAADLYWKGQSVEIQKQKRSIMKYITPKVLNSINATALIKGGKGGTRQDSMNPLDPSTVGGYPADE